MELPDISIQMQVLSKYLQWRFTQLPHISGSSDSLAISMRYDSESQCILIEPALATSGDVLDFVAQELSGIPVVKGTDRLHPALEINTLMPAYPIAFTNILTYLAQGVSRPENGRGLTRPLNAWEQHRRLELRRKFGMPDTNTSNLQKE